MVELKTVKEHILEGGARGARSRSGLKGAEAEHMSVFACDGTEAWAPLCG